MSTDEKKVANESKAEHSQAGHKHEDAHDHGGIFGERGELIFSIACGVVTAAGWAAAHSGVSATIVT